MAHRIDGASPNGISRIAGFMYLGNIITGIAAQAIRSTLIVSGDSGATASKIMAAEWLFRISFMSDLVMAVFYLLMGVSFFRLLKSVNKAMALTMLAFVIAGVSVLAINMLNQFAVLLVLGNTGYMKVFSPDQLEALGMLFMDLQDYGYLIGGFSYCSWLFPLGYLVHKSGYFPKFFGIILMIGCFGGLVDLFRRFLFPGSSSIISTVAMAPWIVAEFSFCFWLLAKGARASKEKQEDVD